LWLWLWRITSKILENGRKVLKQFFLESRFEGKYEDQTINIENLNGGYPSKISQARTFGFYEEIEYLKSQNLIKGGSLDNAIVIKEFQPINPEGLRYDNELMRHKVLDVVGDLYLSGFSYYW